MLSAEAGAAVSRLQIAKLEFVAPRLREREGKSIVYRRNGSGFEAHPVVLGDENDTYVIVSDGLEEGDQIALSDPTVQTTSGALAQGKLRLFWLFCFWDVAQAIGNLWLLKKDLFRQR